jgi:hypothetical protein
LLGKKDDTVRIDTSRMQDLLELSGEPTGTLEIVSEDEENPLRDLKAEVLSIDWEITDRVMTRFIGEVNRLRGHYKEDHVLLTFLKLLESIGNYVKNKKGKAHPDAIKLLSSVYNSLEEVVLLKGASEKERQETLSTEIERFKRLKAQIARRKADKTAKRILRPTVLANQPSVEKPKAEKKKSGPDEPTARAELVKIEALSQSLFAAMEEIKDFISQEMQALRADLELWLERDPGVFKRTSSEDEVVKTQ